MNRMFARGLKTLAGAIFCAVATASYALTVFAAPGDILVKFAQVSDTHVVQTMKDDGGSRMKFKSLQLLKDTVTDINAMEDVDFVFFTGDNIDEQNIPTVDKFKVACAALACPYYMVIGNHDITPDGGSLSKSEYISAFKGYGFQDTRGYYSFDVKGLHFVVLDTVLSSTWGGFVDPDQIQWLKNDLSKNKGKYTFVITHHNLVKLHDDDNVLYFPSNCAEVKSVLSAFPNVKMALSGHHHAMYVKEENGIVYTNVSAIIEYPNAYRLFEVVEGDEGTIEVSLDWAQVSNTDLIELSQTRVGEQVAAWRLGEETDRVNSFTFSLKK